VEINEVAASEIFSPACWWPRVWGLSTVASARDKRLPACGAVSAVPGTNPGEHAAGHRLILCGSTRSGVLVPATGLAPRERARSTERRAVTAGAQRPVDNIGWPNRFGPHGRLASPRGTATALQGWSISRHRSCHLEQPPQHSTSGAESNVNCFRWISTPPTIDIRASSSSDTSMSSTQALRLSRGGPHDTTVVNTPTGAPSESAHRPRDTQRSRCMSSQLPRGERFACAHALIRW